MCYYCSTYYITAAHTITHKHTPGSLVHTGLGSSSLVAHVIHSPLPPREQLYLRYCSNKHTHISYIGSNTPTHTLTIRAFLFSAILSTSTATGVQRIGLVPFQARGSLRVVEEQSRTRGGESGGVTDQHQCRGLWHGSRPNASAIAAFQGRPSKKSTTTRSQA